LTNVRKHAESTRVRIVLSRTGQSVRLEVRDHGRGFVQSEVQLGAGAGERVGLQGMRKRIALLGGRFAVESWPGAGTKILVEVLLPTPIEGNGLGNRSSVNR
jgi:signal transduction histidine kinase